MMRTTLAVGCLMASPVWAEAPRVAADIAPVHALVAQVMMGQGAPDLILPPGATPHAYALRPSEAAAMQDADILVWMGAELSPWMARPVETLTGSAQHIALLDHAPHLLSFRDGVQFEAHAHNDYAGDHADDHTHDHAHEDDHGHDDHDDHADDHGHDDHGHDDHAHDHAEDHSHDGVDPHAWLDPRNAAAWLPVIAEALAAQDPENASQYRANAAAAQAELAALEAEIAAQLADVEGRFIVFHDAYHYFEARFGVEALGAISLSDAAPPTPARMSEIRNLVAEAGVTCVFVEPQFNRGVVDAVFGEMPLRIGVLDPLGAALEPGPDLYAQVLRGMAQAFAECLAPV